MAFSGFEISSNNTCSHLIFDMNHIAQSIISELLHKPGVLITLRRADYHKNIYLKIRDLTPAMYGQSIPAKGGQGH